MKGALSARAPASYYILLLVYSTNERSDEVLSNVLITINSSLRAAARAPTSGRRPVRDRSSSVMKIVIILIVIVNSNNICSNRNDNSSNNLINST